MPELPDVELYLQALAPRVRTQRLDRLRLGNPFVVRTIEPPPGILEGRSVIDLRRLGKRIVFAFDGELFLVLHLMIAGRLRWRERGATIPAKVGMAAFDFPDGTLLLTEAGARSGRPRSTSSAAPRRWTPTTRAASKCSMRR